MKPVILAILLVIIPFLISESFARVLPTLTRVRVQGNRFVTTDGKLMVFRGLSASDPDKLEKSAQWEKDYLAEMKRWGANLVRFPVHPAAWRERGAEAYLALLDQGVAWAGQLGLYVVIDWNSIGNLKTELYQNPTYQTTREETYAFWRTVAARYKNNPTVAFFELFNEPTVMNGALGACTWPEWKAMNEEMISIIRSTGAETIPLVTGFDWAYDLTPVATQPVDADGIAYVSHPYPMKREKPWEDKWTADWGFVAKKYPVMLTQIGFCGPDDKGAHAPVISDESYGDAITAYADANGISYVVGVFDAEWAPRLFSDRNYTPTRQGQYFKKALRKYAGR